MVFRTLAGIIVALLLNSAALALPPVEVAVNPNHPDQYTVVHGDTLWDISGKFLNYPSQWPELWSWNPQIKNPHLIYPGDTLYFSIVNGKPRLSFTPDSETGTLGSGNCVLSEEDIHSGKTNFALAPDNGKLSPCIRQTSNKNAIEIIPSENITKFLSSPRVVGPNDLNLAPYVVDFAGEHMLAATGDKLYVRAILEPESKTYTIYRPGATYKSADTGEVLGYEASYVAEGSVEEPGDPATVAIDKAKIEVLIGDRLMPKLEEQLVLNYFPRPPEQSIKGSIISVLDGVTQIAKYNVVVLDKGASDGLLPGHELDIFKRGRTTLDSNSANRNDWVKLPNELAGKLMVFRVFDRVSYGLIMKATQAVHVLDKVQTP